MTINFQLGLLHLVHLVINADGQINEDERIALEAIKSEEGISDYVFRHFERKVRTHLEHKIYSDGIMLLNRCTEEEKLCAFIHLYRLAEADDNIHEKEIRLLLYALDDTHIDFDDIVVGAQLVTIQKRPGTY